MTLKAPFWLAPLALCLLLAALPGVASPYVHDLIVKIVIYAIFALSLQLLVGFTGLVSFGHAAFFGIAAYITVQAAPAAEQAGLWWILPLAIGGAAAYALFVGLLSLRTKGVYFIMVTLAFAQMAFFVIHDTPLGGGSDGIFLNLRAVLTLGGVTLLDLDQSRQLYWFCITCLLFSWLLLALLERSRFGHALAGIRVNEQRMRAAGFNTYWYKLASFVIAAMLAGLAGFLMATRNGAVNPELLSWHQSGGVLLMIILGGLGSLPGAVLGAAAFILLQELFSNEALFGPAAQVWQLWVGLSMIAFVAALPKGLIGLGRRQSAGGDPGH